MAVISEVLTDHQAIRRWAESRGARPACVKGTGDEDDVGMIRLDFADSSGSESLQPITWDQWFEQFDGNGLALIVQEQTADCQPVKLDEIVKRDDTGPEGRGRARGGSNGRT